ncbi:MAG: hypothetical protein GIW96_11340 [Candidatus Eremiobacteraeota bacterium]|nr:hypothetical protein [Candidatus Eremiobacteraeota bacterium]
MRRESAMCASNRSLIQLPCSARGAAAAGDGLRPLSQAAFTAGHVTRMCTQ